jgi:AcrR family transcriptional regulator
MKSARRSYVQQARAESSRDKRELILNAATEQFLARAYEEVTLVTIAEAAGVSRQTILNHFGSKEGLLECVGRLITRDREGAPAGDTSGAITRLIDNYERMGDANVRMLAIEATVPVAARLQAEGRVAHQRWLAQTFADRMPTRAAERARLLSALHAATDVYVWKLLRRDLALSRKQTQTTIEHLVTGVLSTPLQPAAAASTRTGEST